MLSKKGIRHPQRANCSPDSDSVNSKKRPLESKKPTTGPVCGKLE